MGIHAVGASALAAVVPTTAVFLVQTTLYAVEEQVYILYIVIV